MCGGHAVKSNGQNVLFQFKRREPVNHRVCMSSVYLSAVMSAYPLESKISAEMSVVVIGDQRTGKSSLIQTLCHSMFRKEHTATVGIDYDNRVLDVDGQFVSIHLWDTSGQENFLWVAKKYIGSADGLVFVYDLTEEDSFESLKRWLQLVNRAAPASNLPKLLIGNKLDLRHKQTVSSHRAKEFAIPEGMDHIEVSSNSGQNVSAAFYILASAILRYRKLGAGHRLGLDNYPAVSFSDIHSQEDVARIDDSPEYQHLFKILLVGDARCGKTSLRYKFCRDYFTPEYTATCGFDYSTRTVLIDGEKIKLQVWDVSGDEVYDQTRRGYYRGANAFVICYDVTQKRSFQKAELFLKELDMAGESDSPKIVVGTKSDLSHKRKVDFSQASEWADGWRLPIVETSARHGGNIDVAFLKLASALKRQLAPWKRLYDFS